MKVSVWRGGAQGSFQEFEVPRYPSQTVLDVVTYIQRSLDPTLAYRYACRVGMCGSCAMMVNGVPRWTCRMHVDKVARGDITQIVTANGQLTAVNNVQVPGDPTMANAYPPANWVYVNG